MSARFFAFTALVVATLQVASKASAGVSSAAPPCPAEDGAFVCHDIAYGGVERPQDKLDLYLPMNPPKNRKLFPIIDMHGGCFSYGDKADEKENAKKLLKAGYAVVVPNYTLGTPEKPSYPSLMGSGTEKGDLQRMLEWVNAHASQYSLDAQHKGAFGTSAGGTLAGYLGTRTIFPTHGSGVRRAAVEIVSEFYGRTLMKRRQPKGKGGDCVPNLVGQRETHEKEMAEASVGPVPGVEPARFVVVHGLSDQQVEPINSEALCRNLDKAEKRFHECQLFELPGQGHGGFDDPASKSAWDNTLKAFHQELPASPPAPAGQQPATVPAEVLSDEDTVSAASD